MGMLGGLIGGGGKAKEYEQKARMARAQGKYEQSNYYRQATATEEAARRNSAVDRYNMAAMAGQGERAVGGAEAARAGSGFDIGSGTGGAARRAVRASAMGQMANAAMSSSVTQANAFNAATASRKEGDAALAAREAEARQYDAAAKSVKKGSWFSSALGVVGAVGGALVGGLPGAVMGADMGWDLGASLNPFLADTGDLGQATNNAMGLYGMWENKRGDV